MIVKLALSRGVFDIEDQITKADKGNIAAQVALGLFYLKGIERPIMPKMAALDEPIFAEESKLEGKVMPTILYRDLKLSLKYFKLAAAYGNVDALYFIGKVLIDEVDFLRPLNNNKALVLSPLAKAIKYLTIACDNGHKESHFDLCKYKLLHALLSKEQDGLWEAGLKGSVEFNDGQSNAYDTSIPEQDKAAFNQVKALADTNDIEALILLALCYEYGMGCQVNLEDALTTFLKAASLGSAEAKFALYRFFLDHQAEYISVQQVQLEILKSCTWGAVACNEASPTDSQADFQDVEQDDALISASSANRAQDAVISQTEGSCSSEISSSSNQILGDGLSNTDAQADAKADAQEDGQADAHPKAQAEANTVEQDDAHCSINGLSHPVLLPYFNYLQQAASQGHYEAMLTLARSLLYGHDGVIDPKLALRWLYKAARKSDGYEAQYPLAQCLFFNHSMDKHYELAFKYYSALADLGFADAQFMVGYIHFKGLGGIERNHVIALDYFLRALKQGNLRAFYFLGKGHIDGQYGVEQDLVLGREFLEQGAYLGSEEAAEALDDYIERGILPEFTNLEDEHDEDNAISLDELEEENARDQDKPDEDDHADNKQHEESKSQQDLKERAVASDPHEAEVNLADDSDELAEDLDELSVDNLNTAGLEADELADDELLEMELESHEHFEDGAYEVEITAKELEEEVDEELWEAPYEEGAQITVVELEIAEPEDYELIEDGLDEGEE